MNNTEIRRPVIGITMGDPAGNGPELCVQALLHKAIYEECRPLIVGDANVIEKAAVLLGHPELTVHRVDSVEQAAFTWGIIDVYHLDLVDLARFEYGKVSAMCGRAAGMHFDGHTEIYAHYTHTEKYTMLLAHHDLRVVHVSTHCSLREACDRVKKQRVLDVIHIADSACRSFGIPRPRIAVAGLNPHAGENGLFGREELDEIIPAIRAAQDEGLCVDGPVPPDSLFPKALGGWYDIVVAMYHDQGHIPLKTVGFVYDREKQAWKAVEGVNITLGLPIIRTSVDHGTGFDQAGKGTSNELSLLNAIQYAVTMARNRNIKE